MSKRIDMREGLKAQVISKRFWLLAVWVTAIILLGAGRVMCVVNNIDRDMRNDFLQQARMAAQGVNIERVRALKGEASDSNSVAYLRLKEQLNIFRSSNPLFRFVYFTGRRTDGTIFFYVDNEPIDSPAMSPPGQTYSETTSALQKVFATQVEVVDGPYKDRWGKWISAQVPITDPRAKVFSIATMDDARALVSRALDYYHKRGREEFLKSVNDPRGEFRIGDLYAFVYDRNMTMLAHPTKPDLVGQNLLDVKDWPGGKFFRRSIQSMALSQGRGVVEYEYENPANRQREPKTTYFERVDDLIICSGVYKGNGSVLAVMGIDISANDWQLLAIQKSLPHILVTIFVVILALLGIVLWDTRSRMKIKFPYWARYLEAIIICLVGLMVTLFASWDAYQRELVSRKEAFMQLATLRTSQITGTFMKLRDIELESLMSFYASDCKRSYSEFQQFSGYLTKNPAVQAWGWVPVIKDDAKLSLEEAISAAGMNGFNVWQKNSQGKREPASGRDVYYPILHITPYVFNYQHIGFDLGSEKTNLLALDEAKRTGFPSTTNPVVLSRDHDKQKGLLVVHPVFDREEPAYLQGFVMATLKMRTLLMSMGYDGSVLTEISLLKKDAPKELLATSWDEASQPALRSLNSSRTFFAFGRAFLVTAYAGKEFIALYPIRMGWIVFFVGLVLTMGGVFIAVEVIRRRDVLESMVQSRTKDLQESEASYRNQFAGNSAVMLLIEPEESVIVDVNTAAVNFYGYPREKLVGMKMSDISTRPLTELKECMASVQAGFGRQLQCRHRLADGTLRNIEVAVSRIQFSGKDVLHAIIHDITERTLAEDALKESEALQRALFNSLPAGVVIIDPVTRVIERVNAYVATLFGAPTDSLIGKRCHLFLCPAEEGACPVCDFGKSVDNSERILLKADGTRIPILKTVKRVQLGGKEKLLECFVDLSEIKKMEIVLRENHDLLRNVIEGTNAGIWRWNVQTGEVEVNERWSSIMGYRLSEIAPVNMDSWNDYLHPDDRAMSKDLLNKHFIGVLDYYNFECRVRHKNGTWAWVHDRGKVVQKSPDGRPLIVSGTRADITTRKRVEEALLRTNRELIRATEQSNAANIAKGQFIANMSHEIRTPMNAVIGFASLLQETNLDDLQKRYLETIKNSGEVLLALINDILDISKIEAGKIELESINFDLEYLVGDLVKSLYPRAREKGLDLRFLFQSNMPRWFVGDPTRIRQIILNLVNNAIKFTSKGSVEINVRMVEVAQNFADQARVTIAVKDTGIGISEKEMGKLFQAFSQVDSTITRRFGGTGLGLAISKVFAKKMGGDITVTSEIGVGSEFTAYIVLGKGTGQPPQGLLMAEEHMLKDKLVAIVDDNAHNRQVTKAYCEQAGMRVAYVMDAAKALLDKLAADKIIPDVVISDIMMPGVSGLDMVKELRKDDKFTQVKILALSSDARPGVAKEAMHAGFNAYVPKPVLQKELVGVICTMFGDKRENKEIVTRHTAKEVSLEGVRVLVVEDVAANWELLSIYLDMFGCVKDYACNGQEAVEKVKANEYDVCLMDMQMPVMDGVRATTIIRNELGKTLPIIALTAAVMKEDRDKAESAGMNDFLTKPIEVDSLKSALLKWGK